MSLNCRRMTVCTIALENFVLAHLSDRTANVLFVFLTLGALSAVGEEVLLNNYFIACCY